MTEKQVRDILIFIVACTVGMIFVISVIGSSLSNEIQEVKQLIIESNNMSQDDLKEIKENL